MPDLLKTKQNKTARPPFSLLAQASLGKLGGFMPPRD
jgi:hypothetical protein